MSSSLNQSLLTAVADGAVLLTVNRRLARELSNQYDDHQQYSGQQVWETPAIYPLEDWLQQCLRQLAQEHQLLDADQASCLWEQVIREDLIEQDYDLLQVQATVRQVIQAHRLSCDYRLESYCPMGDEQQAFLRWQQLFQKRCQLHGWLDRCQLLLIIEQAVTAGSLLLPTQMIWLGFDELNPAQHTLQQALRQQGCAVTQPEPEAVAADGVSLYRADDETSELIAAAQWARQRLEQQVGTVAVVVPDLARLQGTVERTFRAELSRSAWPDRVPADTFNVSLGYPLAQQGMIAAALELLQLEDEIDFETLSYLLRCPWFKGGHSEEMERASCERWLRQRNVRTISISGLLKLLPRSPQPVRVFIDCLQHLQSVQQQNDQMAPAMWAERLQGVLDRVGWPGEQALDSEAFQVFAAWQQKIVPALAGLGRVLPRLDRRTAVSRLRQLASELLFQPKAQDQRLQITGILETAGLQFDALWVVGMTDQVLPGVVEFNPFLPVSTQRDYAMPHSSVEHEDLYARKTLQRLLAAAPDVVISYASLVQETDSRCSPFVAERFAVNDVPEQQRETRTTLAIEPLVDDSGCALDEETLSEPIKGGTGLLKEQVQCPFRAFSHYRLRSRALEVPQAGLTSRCRGDLMHLVLQQFWAETKDHQQLLSLSDDQLKQRVEQLVEQVVSGYVFAEHERGLLTLERQRLQQLILEWLELEKGRGPFAVVTVEQRQQLQVGPLTLMTIPDRVDQLAKGEQVVIDYKSGKVSATDLLGEHLLEPQLPIYALEGVEGDVAAVTFAQVRHGECCFKGVSAEEGVLPGVQGVEKSRAAKRGLRDWSQLLDDWQLQLQASAQGFAAGDAEVRPVAKKVCQFCDLKALCRIELAESVEEAADE